MCRFDSAVRPRDTSAQSGQSGPALSERKTAKSDDPFGAVKAGQSVPATRRSPSRSGFPGGGSWSDSSMRSAESLRPTTVIPKEAPRCTRPYSRTWRRVGNLPSAGSCPAGRAPHPRFTWTVGARGWFYGSRIRWLDRLDSMRCGRTSSDPHLLKKTRMASCRISIPPPFPTVLAGSCLVVGRHAIGLHHSRAVPSSRVH
jgi:hypothetical protein